MLNLNSYHIAINLPLQMENYTNLLQDLDVPIIRIQSAVPHIHHSETSVCESHVCGNRKSQVPQVSVVTLEFLGRTLIKQIVTLTLVMLNIFIYHEM